MQRRNFITLLGGTLAAWPFAARAQKPAMPVIGFLHSATLESRGAIYAAFHRGLGEAGFAEGRNVSVEYRWAENIVDRLPALAAELVRRKVDVIFAGGPPPAMAAKSATATIPVVFTSGVDPVKAGLVVSLNKPGGNVTGVNVFLDVLEGKRLGLLRELLPRAADIGVLHFPEGPATITQLNDIELAARAIGWQVRILNARTEQDIHGAFMSFAQSRIGALLVAANPFFNSRRDQLVTLAAHYAIPAIYELREYAVAGGLMSYGTSLPDAYRQAGLYTARILNGEKPADLPVMQSTKFELVINLKTAKALGLEVPAQLLARADEVIE
jgi:putative ABC transport system substrate-binding protein